VLNDIDAVGALCRARDVTLHVDAVQSAGKLPIDVATGGVALLSFCAHKLAGPKGVGALYMRRRPRPALQPLQFGGSHEGGLRPGTLATHQLVGFGAACELARMALDTEPVRIRALRDRLWLALQAAAPLWRNGAPEPSVPGILNVGFAGVEGESLLLELDGRLAVASGAACSSATAEPSAVLRALGRSDMAIQASLRLSLGRDTTVQDVDRAAALLARFGLERRAWDRVERLSGGEQGRVAIARSLINNPRIVIADEPTAHLDSSDARVFLDLVDALRAEGRTVVVASHDTVLSESGCFNRIYRLRSGRLEGQVDPR